MVGTAMKAIGGVIKAGGKIGQGIASYIDMGDKQNEARKLEEMRRRYQQRATDRQYMQSDEKDARYGDEIMRNRALMEENKQLAEQDKNYQRGERTIGKILEQINNSPQMRAKTLEIFRGR